MAPIEYLVQINAPAIIAVDGDSASARSLIRECAKFRGRAGVIDVVGQFNDELREPPTAGGSPIARSRSSERTCQPRPSGGNVTEITGKAAVVTGGGSGIGMGLAKELARQGASVAVADILADTAAKVADEINDAGGTAVAIDCDVCDRSSIEQMKTEANAALGTIQLVFANAGATSFVPATELTDSELDWMTEVNMKGVIWTALTFLPDMIEAGGGHITATASMAGLIPTLVPIHSAYSGSQDGCDRVHPQHAARGRRPQRCLHDLLPGRRAQQHARQQREIPPRAVRRSKRRTDADPARIVQGQPAAVPHARTCRPARPPGGP